MRTTVSAGRMFGTPIHLHISLILVLPLYAVVFGLTFFELYEFPLGFGDSTYPIEAKLVFGAFLAVFLYLAIIIHELGHVWAARYKGFTVTGVTLFFVGGISEMEHPKDWPKGEAEVAVAGAMTSVTVGLALLVIFYLTIGEFEGWAETVAAIVLSGFGLFNFFLGIMNLLPILPMDGGVLLRDVIRIDLGLKKASSVTVLVSRIVALLIVAIGIYLLSWIIFLVGVLLLLTISPKQLEG